jgi:hypothetical protein
VNDQHGRRGRLRYTATGALAALAAVGAIAGTTALAASPTSPVQSTTQGPQSVGAQPFLSAIQPLVDNGTITAAEGQTVDQEIQAGTVDESTLASSGFTPTQLQAVQQALSNVKLAQAATARRQNGTSRTDAQRARHLHHH